MFFFGAVLGLILTFLIVDSSMAFFELKNPLNVDTIWELIVAIARFVFVLGIILAPLMFIISGFLFITSGGSEQKVKTARNMFLYTVIGLAIVLVSMSLGWLIQQLLEG